MQRNFEFETKILSFPRWKKKLLDNIKYLKISAYKKFSRRSPSDTYELLYTSLNDRKYIITLVHPFTWYHRLFMC